MSNCENNTSDEHTRHGVKSKTLGYLQLLGPASLAQTLQKWLQHSQLRASLSLGYCENISRLQTYPYMIAGAAMLQNVPWAFTEPTIIKLPVLHRQKDLLHTPKPCRLNCLA